MAYNESLTALVGGTGKVGTLVNGGNLINFSQIFDGVPQYFPGSTFQVEEIFTLELFVDDVTLVDIDFSWFPDKYYAGSWTIVSGNFTTGISSEDRGYLEYLSCAVKRYSLYTIEANPDVPQGIHEFSRIDNCNFLLNTINVSVPGFEVGQQYPSVNDSVFVSKHSLTKVPLIDRPFNQKIRNIGLFIKPGLSIISANYRAEAINSIRVDVEAFPTSSCNIVPQDSCDGLYQIWLSSNGLNSLPPNSLFPTQAAAQAYAMTIYTDPQQYGIGDYTFTCPIAPFTVYSLWLLVPIQI